MRGERGQVSLELLLLLAAFMAATLLLLPSAIEVQERSRDALSQRYARLALMGLAHSAEEVSLLGDGNSQELELLLLEEGEAGFDAGRSILWVRVGTSTLEEKAKAGIKFPRSRLFRGRNSALVKNSGGSVEIGLLPP